MRGALVGLDPVPQRGRVDVEQLADVPAGGQLRHAMITQALLVEAKRSGKKAFGVAWHHDGAARARNRSGSATAGSGAGHEISRPWTPHRLRWAPRWSWQTGSDRLCRGGYPRHGWRQQWGRTSDVLDRSVADCGDGSVGS